MKKLELSLNKIALLSICHTTSRKKWLKICEELNKDKKGKIILNSFMKDILKLESGHNEKL